VIDPKTKQKLIRGLSDVRDIQPKIPFNTVASQEVTIEAKKCLMLLDNFPASFKYLKKWQRTEKQK
jgi:hypothetical protein